MIYVSNLEKLKLLRMDLCLRWVLASSCLKDKEGNNTPHRAILADDGDLVGVLLEREPYFIDDLTPSGMIPIMLAVQ